MPVHSCKKGGKHRLCDPNGKIAINSRTGKPIDGGGHSSRGSAIKQVQAVNISLKKQGKI
jgi:hypothetical protein